MSRSNRPRAAQGKDGANGTNGTPRLFPDVAPRNVDLSNQNGETL